MAGVMWRLLLGILGFLLGMKLIPALLRVLSINVSSDVEMIITVCLGIIALVYIAYGPTPPLPGTGTKVG